MKKRNPSARLRSALLLILGSALGGFTINLLYVPISLTMGGVSGIASIIYQLTGRGAGLSFGFLVLLLNIPLLLLGWWQIGLRFVWKSIVGTIVYSLAIDWTKPFMADWFDRYLNLPLKSGNADPLIYCIFGGILYGISMGLIIRAGFTTGGTDILAVVIHRRARQFSLGQILMVLDVLVVLATLFVYTEQGRPAILLALYSFLAMALTAKSIDITLEGTDFTRAAYIIAKDPQLIAEQIFKRLNRGATRLPGQGMYSGADRDVILCVLSNRQVPQLKQLVREIDPSAFIIVMEAREVLGEGFESDSVDFLN